TLTIRTQDGGKMRKLRYLPSERFVDRNLFRGVGDVVVAANDVGDAHQRVVDRYHVVVDRHPGARSRSTAFSRTHQDRIADGVRGKFEVAAHDVVELDGV